MLKQHLYILIFLVSTLSCTQQKQQGQLNQKPYFDLSRYFQQQAQYLANKKQTVKKTVSKNDLSEKKTLQLTSWTNELELFRSSDINKADWLNSYTVDSTVQLITYHSKDPKLRTKRIAVYKNPEGTIQRISILNSDKNWLYQSVEQLDYFPDSHYKISKKQTIRIMGENTYTIEGKFL